MASLASSGIDLTPEQFLLIDILWDDDGLTQQQIANEMQKDKNSITKLIDGLEKKGYVYRAPDSEDRRKNYVFVSEKGQAQKQEITRVALIAVDSILKGVSQEEVVALVDILSKMNRNMKNLLQDSKREF